MATNGSPAQREAAGGTRVRDRAYFYVELYHIFGPSGLTQDFIRIYLKAAEGEGSSHIEEGRRGEEKFSVVIAEHAGETVKARIESQHRKRVRELMEVAGRIIDYEKGKGASVEQLVSGVAVSLGRIHSIVSKFNLFFESEGKVGWEVARGDFRDVYDMMKAEAEREKGSNGDVAMLPAFIAAELFCMYVVEKAERADPKRKERYDSLVARYWKGTLAESEVAKIKANPIEEKVLKRKASERAHHAKQAQELVEKIGNGIANRLNEEEAVAALDSEPAVVKDSFSTLVDGKPCSLKKKIAAELFSKHREMQLTIENFFKWMIESEKGAKGGEAANARAEESRAVLEDFEDKFGAGSFPIALGKGGSHWTMPSSMLTDEAIDLLQRSIEKMRARNGEAAPAGNEEQIDKMREMLSWFYRREL